MENHYVTLGVMQDATERELVYAYRHLARKLHPDLHPDDPEAGARFAAVQEAYDVLRDPAARRRHDTRLAADGIVPPGTAPTLVVVPTAPRRRARARSRAPRRPPTVPLRAQRAPDGTIWWAPPVYALVAFALVSLGIIAAVGWDVFQGVGRVVAGVLFIGGMLGFLAHLYRAALTRR